MFETSTEFVLRPEHAEIVARYFGYVDALAAYAADKSGANGEQIAEIENAIFLMRKMYDI